MNRKDYAAELFSSGYNCAQAVAGACKEDVLVDFDSLMKISVSFGGGIGGMRGMCGAVCGMFIISGLLTDNPGGDPLKKKEQYEVVQALAEEFKKQNNTLICSEHLNRIKSGETKRSCRDMVCLAVEVVEKILLKG